jgi:flagellar capping protein FliD
MQTVTILEVSDIQEVLDQVMTPWVQWSESVMTQMASLEDRIDKQNRRINAMKKRIESLEESVASTDTYSDTY